ncbi:2Fe-2S iron-sulfur cluster-binding protein [Chloroflexota bacterium]
MKKVTLKINGQEVTTPEGTSLLWAALDNDIYIPNLCAIREKSEPATSCRLCFVEIEGYSQPVTACTEMVREGMVVDTKGKEAVRLATAAFDLLMSSHPVDCANCLANGNCELQNIAKHLRVSLKPKRFRKLLHDLPIDDSNPKISYNPNKCVLCGRCLWECRRQGIGVLGFAHRGFERVVTTFGDEPMEKLGCGECVECVSVCPTGAFVLKDGKMIPASRHCPRFDYHL